MTEVTVPEAVNGIIRTLVINRRGQTTPENLSSFTTANLAITSINHSIIYNSSISLAITDSANGVLTWTLDSTTDGLPNVPDSKDELTVLGQVTLSGASVADYTEKFTIIIKKNITS